MTLEGYEVRDVVPWETASGGKDVVCPRARCTATFRYSGPSGERDVIVQYFDESGGASRFEALVGGRRVDAWAAGGTFPTAEANGHSATWHRIPRVRLAEGDEVRIVGVPDAGEPAPLDYVEVADPLP
jgi:alpha-glucuronidase